MPAGAHAAARTPAAMSAIAAEAGALAEKGTSGLKNLQERILAASELIDEGRSSTRGPAR